MGKEAPVWRQSEEVSKLLKFLSFVFTRTTPPVKPACSGWSDFLRGLSILLVVVSYTDSKTGAMLQKPQKLQGGFQN